jgi:hypothetical protein
MFEQLGDRYFAAQAKMRECAAAKDYSGYTRYLGESEAYLDIFNDLSQEIGAVTDCELRSELKSDLKNEWARMQVMELGQQNGEPYWMVNFDGRFGRADDFIARHSEGASPPLLLSPERMELRRLLIGLCRLPFKQGPVTALEQDVWRMQDDLARLVCDARGGGVRASSLVQLALYGVTLPPKRAALLDFLRTADERFKPSVSSSA